MSLYSQLRNRDTIQGVEFTEISGGNGELGWSKCDGMMSRCKDFRATVSCANDGRMFGSLENKNIRYQSNWIQPYRSI